MFVMAGILPKKILKRLARKVRGEKKVIGKNPPAEKPLPQKEEAEQKEIGKIEINIPKLQTPERVARLRTPYGSKLEIQAEGQPVSVSGVSIPASEAKVGEGIKVNLESKDIDRFERSVGELKDSVKTLEDTSKGIKIKAIQGSPGEPGAAGVTLDAPGGKKEKGQDAPSTAQYNINFSLPVEEGGGLAGKQQSSPVLIDPSGKIATAPVIVNFSDMDLKEQLELYREKRRQSDLKNLPAKAQEIPKEFVQKMSSAWVPPSFSEIDQKYFLIEPFAMANLRWNPDKHDLEYYVFEPYLTAEERAKLEKVKDLVIDLLDVNLLEVKDKELVKDLLKSKVNSILKDYNMNMDKAGYDKLLYYINRDFLGLERIEPMMQDETIEDLSCDGVGVPLYIYHRKYGSIPTNRVFSTDAEINGFIVKLAQRCGHHISVASPLLDGALPDGSRVQATYSSGKDIAMRGSTFTIRKFARDPLTITDMMNFGTLPPLVAAYIWLAIEYKKSLLVSGGTATGKTSLLNAISMFIPVDLKIVSIEDTPEIKLPHENWVQKVIRPGFGPEGISGKKQGEVGMFDLLKAALRERPDEVVVGEVRGKEAYVLFQGMATGHPGLSTIHADSVDAVIHRLQTPPINLSPGLLQHLNIVLILVRAKVKGMDVRRIKNLVEIVGVDPRTDRPVTNTLIKWVPSEDTFEFSSDKSYVMQSIIEDKGVPEESIWEEMRRRAAILRWMRNNNIRYYKDVGEVIKSYYSNPEELLKRIGEEVAAKREEER
jgi:flagellar protein FlaI